MWRGDRDCSSELESETTIIGWSAESGAASLPAGSGRWTMHVLLVMVGGVLLLGVFLLFGRLWSVGQ
jgi:hypothetical protein